MTTLTINARQQVTAIIENTISARKGANVNLCWRRKAKTLKSAGAILVEKEVCTVGRVGIDYDNKKSTIEGRQSGELPKENAGLPSWQKWQWFPYILEHKVTGQLYLRLNSSSSKNGKQYVQWYVNGVEAEYSEAERFLLASEKPNNKPKTVFQVKIEDMNYVEVVE